MQANKSLGQNFLKDEAVVEAIAKAAVAGPEDEVLEIGPGLGILTEALAVHAARVTAVEIDSRLIPILRTRLFGFKNVTLVNEDFLKLDINELLSESDRPLRIVGNLPYYITTPILMKLLEDGVDAASVTVMVQKEVAEKIMAAPGSKVYGVLAAILQYFYDVRLVIEAPAACFDPRPKVDSAVIQLVPRFCSAALGDRPGDALPLRLSSSARFRYISLVKAAFSQRRKTLPNSLAGYLGKNKEQWASLLRSAGIDPGLRAEALSPGAFESILGALHNN